MWLWGPRLKQGSHPLSINHLPFTEVIFMAHRLEPNELVTFKELLMANSIQVDTAVLLLIEKGFFTEQEFYAKLKQVQAQYQSKGH
jgi:hypothetical protein